MHSTPRVVSFVITIFMVLGLFIQSLVFTKILLISLDMRGRTSQQREKRLRLKVLLAERKVPRELRAMGGTVAKKGKRPAAARAPLSANVARAENRGQQGPRLAFRL